MNIIEVVVPKNAPIRQSIYEETLCKNCEKVLNDCSRYNRETDIRNGYHVVLRCSGFIEQT